MILGRIIRGFLIAGWAGSAFAGSADVTLSDQSARFTYSSGVAGSQDLNLDLGYLYNTDSTHLVTLGVQVVGQSNDVSGLSAGIGGRIYAASARPENVGKHDLMAVALGTDIRYKLPDKPLALGVYGYFAPKIVSFLDAERLSEFGLRAEYQILPQSFVYVGYREIKAAIENGPDITVDDGAHVGLRIQF